MTDETKGMALGVVGVAIFSVTLPATRIAVGGLDSDAGGLDPVIVGLGRAVVAAAVAILILAVARKPPPRMHWPRLTVVALGVVVGFPLCATIAMRSAPAAHGAVMLGVLPLATSVAAAVLGGERPSLGFWLLAALGGGLVVAFALIEGVGRLSGADLWLLAAVVSAGVGYAVGGELARKIGGWQVICWALVASLPFILPPVAWMLPAVEWRQPWPVWAAFAYVALFSQLIGFFAWNRGLAIGGVARVSQVQLLQPFMTLGFAALLLGEGIGGPTLAFSAAVVATVGLGRRMPIRRPSLQ